MPHNVASPKTPSPPGHLATTLKRLIEVKEGKDGVTYSQERIAADVTRLYQQAELKKLHTAQQAAGVEPAAAKAEEEALLGKLQISRQYVGKLLNDPQANPSQAILAALGEFFQITPEVFFPDTKAAREFDAVFGLRKLKRSGADVSVFARGLQALDEQDPDAAAATLAMALSLLDHTKAMRNDAN